MNHELDGKAKYSERSVISAEFSVLVKQFNVVELIGRNRKVGESKLAERDRMVTLLSKSG